MLLISINNRLVKTLISLTLIGVLSAFLFACGGQKQARKLAGLTADNITQSILARLK